MNDNARPTPSWTNDPSINPRELITLADVIGTGGYATPGNSTNSILLNLGIASTGESYTQDAILFSPPGLLSIPVPPGTYDSSGNFTPSSTSATGTQAIAMVRDDQWIVLGTRDTRTQLQAGNLGPGETCLYALLGQARVSLKPDGSVTLMTTSDNTANGSNIQFNLTPSGLYFTAPFGSITFDQYGFRVTTSAGANFSMLASQNPTTGNTITMTAGSTTISSGMIILGNPVNTAVPFPVVYGVIPAAAPGIPILGEGVGEVVVNAAASTSVFVGI